MFKMKNNFIITLLEILLFLTLTHAYIGLILLDTKNGYCEAEGVRIAVGDVSYNDEQCEMLRCSEGELRVTGCAPMRSSRPWCRLVPGEGRFPMCCPHIEECDEANNAAEISFDGI
ncbi:toxin-like protein 14 [Parasteatoda tepidariorum]|uniref:toxin-like protein 14 n=1 Tax=Parasteatoda tepidariorum TaxID=114398 RepID=UPI00077FD6F6|nr:toxin-like protein 14 [Parasteatoda tepidariorum]